MVEYNKVNWVKIKETNDSCNKEGVEGISGGTEKKRIRHCVEFTIWS
jgi:hypothetical protein